MLVLLSLNIYFQKKDCSWIIILLWSLCRIFFFILKFIYFIFYALIYVILFFSKSFYWLISKKLKIFSFCFFFYFLFPIWLLVNPFVGPTLTSRTIFLACDFKTCWGLVKRQRIVNEVLSRVNFLVIYLFLIWFPSTLIFTHLFLTSYTL